MKKLIRYIKNISSFLGAILLFNLVLSLFNLMGLTKNTSSIILFILNILLFFVFGFINGTKTNKKGVLEGLKTAFFLITIMLLLSLILYDYNFKMSNLIYYLILGLSSIFGAIFGKNKK